MIRIITIIISIITIITIIIIIIIIVIIIIIMHCAKEAAHRQVSGSTLAVSKTNVWRKGDHAPEVRWCVGKQISTYFISSILS